MLAAHGFSTVGVIGTFDNGRVERYAPGRVLTLEEMRERTMADKIATVLARFHSIDVPDGMSDGEAQREPALWRFLERWLALAVAVGVELPLSLDEAAIHAAIDALRTRIEERARAPRVVFAHNDVSALNLVYNSATSEVALIDFEYSRYNYAAFDIANHLFEYAGSGPIHWDQLPTEEEQMRFVRRYVRAMRQHARDPPPVPVRECAHDDVGGQASFAEDEQQAEEAEVRALYDEVRAFAPASHLFWGLWALVRSVDAAPDFDYAGYAEERLRCVFSPQGHEAIL